MDDRVGTVRIRRPDWRVVVAEIMADELLSEVVGDKLTYIPTTTREQSDQMGRMTDWVEDGRFEAATGAPLNAETDRVMICGSMGIRNSADYLSVPRISTS